MQKVISTKQLLYIAALLGWMALVFYMSSQIATTSSGFSSLFVEPIRPYSPGFAESILTTLVRKSAHVFLYFVLGVLSLNVFRKYITEKKKLIMTSRAFVILYAVSDEIHQMFVPGRSGEVRDVLIDSIAGLLGIAVCCYLLWGYKRKS